MSEQPLIFLQILANQKLNPEAVLMDLGEGDVNAFLPVLTHKDFNDFRGNIPCYIGTNLANRLPPELKKEFQDAGCKIIVGEQLHHFDEYKKPILAPTAQWLIGNWYFAPPANKPGNQAGSRSLSLKLLQLVAADADTRDIESIFRQDPILAYHLLRLVNSLGVGVGRHIASFSQAILILGRQQLKRWLNLMLFAASRDDYRAGMLMTRVTIRARSMELLAKSCGYDRSVQEHAFMAGMFSLLGILFGMPLDKVIIPLKLCDALTKAVLHHEGVIGTLLEIVDNIECGDEPSLNTQLASINLSSIAYNQLVIEAHQWMLGVIHNQQESLDA